VRDSLEFVLVDRVEQVLETALLPAGRSRATSRDQRNGKLRAKK
jgi:hypothetical protein